MSLTFIHDFQNQLYILLSSDKEIMKSVKKIYLGAMQDGKTPCLLITINKAENLSLHLESIYSVEFQISAYAKDNNYQLLVQLGDRIVEILESVDANFSGYVIAGIKANNLVFEKAKDLVMNKLMINYQALIKKSVVYELS